MRTIACMEDPIVGSFVDEFVEMKSLAGRLASCLAPQSQRTRPGRSPERLKFRERYSYGVGTAISPSLADLALSWMEIRVDRRVVPAGA